MKLARLKALTFATLLCLVVSHPALATTITFGTGVNQFNMAFVPIGNPGNAADTTGNPTPAQTGGVGVGGVSYNYSIGMFEVSRDMITKANNLSGLGITMADLSSFGGNGFNRPATGVSWNEAARFTNWLNTSTGGFAAYKFTTSGVNDNIALWTPSDTLDYDAANPFRSLRANYVIPNYDEWYKAAYYDPNTSTYYDYPTGSNSTPMAVAGGTSPGTAVYNGQLGPADVNNAGGLSPYGIMGLGGNVFEWQETESDLVNKNASSFRGVRGGNWFHSSNFLSSSTWSSFRPTDEDGLVGFRVASLSSTAVPEPSSLTLWSLTGISGLLFRRHRLRK